jgi:hypothetical protein
MGSNLNIHTNYTPEDRAEAERIAVVRQRAFAGIMHAGADFDAAGQAFWESQLPEAVEACHRAYDDLREARQMLLAVDPDDMALRLRHRESPKVKKALELGLGGFGYNPEAFTARALVYDRRVVQLIDHMLTGEQAAVASLEDGQIEGLYSAVSVSCRQLFEVVAEHIGRLTADARLTHEAADIVGMVWTPPEAAQTPASAQISPDLEREAELVSG